MKAAVTKWLFRGAACNRYRERYHIIITEVFVDSITTLSNPELVACEDTLLETATVYQITLLEDVLSLTVVQSDKRVFLLCHVH